MTLTPQQLGIKAQTPADCQDLSDIRQAIDTLDHAVVEMLGLRLGYVLEASRFKPNATAIPAPERVAAMLPVRRKWAEENGLNPDFVVPLFAQIIQWFIQQQVAFWQERHESNGQVK